MKRKEGEKKATRRRKCDSEEFNFVHSLCSEHVCMCMYISMRAKCPKYSLFLFEIREDDDDDDDDYDD